MSSHPDPGSGTPARRLDASMTLITQMLERPLDPGYQEAADRRTAAGLPRATSTTTVVVIVMLLLTGFLFALGARSLRTKPTATVAVKADLVQRIEDLQTLGTQQEAKLEAVGKEVRDLEALALEQSGLSGITDRLKTLSIAAGAQPLVGTGLTLTLDDAPAPKGDADAGSRPSSGFTSGRVASADLQIIVNGLWASGAEAISINGHRLTSMAAIRFAGQAIIVDFRPLARPYVITALGDPDQMRSAFDPSFAGLYLQQLTEQFAIPATWTSSQSLRVPGSSSLHVSLAQPLPGNVGSPTGAGSSEGGAPPTGATR
ncbi:MAG: DUF881 domain-containing protein [Dermatophilaceae bacterium]